MADLGRPDVAVTAAADPDQLDRYLRSYTTEATARRDGDSDLAAYLATRQDSIGIPPSVNLAEPLHQVELPPGLADRPPLSRLMALTGQHVALVNDLFSAGKERACGETYNSVLIIQRARQCAPASAARQVMDMIAAIHQEFQQLSAELAGLLDRQAASQRERTAVAVHLACMRLDALQPHLVAAHRPVQRPGRVLGPAAAAVVRADHYTAQYPMTGTVH